MSQRLGDDAEWVVVDGGSTDASVDHLSALELPFLRWTSERDTGIYNAMNRGLNLARGKFVQFLNSGDIYSSPAAVGDVIAVCRAQQDEPMIGFGATLLNSAGQRRLRRAFPAAYIRHGMPCVHQALVYPKEQTAEVGGYDEQFLCCGDYDLTARLLIAQTRYVRSPTVIVDFELGGYSSQNLDVLDREARAVQCAVLGLSPTWTAVSSGIRRATSRRPVRHPRLESGGEGQ